MSRSELHTATWSAAEVRIPHPPHPSPSAASAPVQLNDDPHKAKLLLMPTFLPGSSPALPRDPCSPSCSTRPSCISLRPYLPGPAAPTCLTKPTVDLKKSATGKKDKLSLTPKRVPSATQQRRPDSYLPVQPRREIVRVRVHLHWRRRNALLAQ